MSEKLQENIVKAIEKDLPKQVSDVLKERLDKVDILESQVENLNVQAKINKQQITGLNVTKQELIEQVSKFNDLAKREDAIIKKEIESKVEAEKVKSADEKVVLVKELFNTVFANNVIKKSTLENITKQHVDGNGYNSGATTVDIKNTNTDEDQE